MTPEQLASTLADVVMVAIAVLVVAALVPWAAEFVGRRSYVPPDLEALREEQGRQLAVVMALDCLVHTGGRCKVCRATLERLSGEEAKR